MGGKGSGPRRTSPRRTSLAITAYWAKFTPEQRSQMMIQRRAKAKRKLIARLRGGREEPSTESPFEEASSSNRSLKALLADLENVVNELKTMFGV